MQIIIELATKNQLNNLKEKVNKSAFKTMSFFKRSSPNTTKLSDLDNSFDQLQNDYTSFVKSNQNTGKNDMIGLVKDFYDQAVNHLTETLSLYYELSSTHSTTHSNKYDDKLFKMVSKSTGMVNSISSFIEKIKNNQTIHR